MSSIFDRTILLTAAIVAFTSVPSFAETDGSDEITARYPVAFSYEGQPFDPSSWNPVTEKAEGRNLRTRYTSPDGKLALEMTYVRYSDFPVVEIRPVLECIGETETGIIDDFKSLEYTRACSETGVKIRRITGSDSRYTDFTRHDVLLQNRYECESLTMENPVGRACFWLPYIGIDYDALSGEEIAVGWTGTWKADMSCTDAFRFSLGLAGGTHFKMLPGERFQMPYTVIYERSGKTLEDGLVDFHRFMIEYKTPRDAKGNIFKPLLPLTASGGNKTDENMLMILDKATKTFGNIPFDTYWVDAGWYGDPHETPQETNCGPYWYKWAGNWKANTWSHPDGNMMKVSKAAARKGMKFLLWFEPERATIHAPIVSEHPEYFHRPKENPSDECYLLDLGNPEARRWITDEVSRNIRESGVKIYRQDFNLNPAQIWKDADAPDRQGVTEIKHINGLYAFWDELHERFPDMMFENCAGGGTRMDIEMMSRSHSYCRDDAHMFAHSEELCQNITLNSTCYIPFTGGETFTVPVFDTYSWMSHMAAGTVFTPTDFQGMFLNREPSEKEISWFTKMLEVSDRIRPLFFGDFHVLMQPALDNSACYVGYQLDEKKSAEGFFIVFRREKCLEDCVEICLRDIDPEATYVVEQFEGEKKTLKGSEFTRQVLSFDEPRSVQLFFYRKK